jgi:proton glutamate symport protein
VPKLENLINNDQTMNQSTKIYIALGLGVLSGLLINIFASDSTIQFLDKKILTLIGAGFIRLIQFIIVPLILIALTLAMSNIGDLKKIGRYSIKLLALYFFTSSISLIVGIFLAKIMKPGVGIEMVHQEVSAYEGISLVEWILRILPKNPFEALSSGNMLQVIISALLIGLGITMAGEKGKPFLSFFESAYEVVVKMTQVILRLVPLGVFALIASVIATQGLGIINNLFLYVIGLIIGVFIIKGGMYSILLLLAGLNLLKFWRAFSPAFAFAFATASSSATLPLAMDNAENR